MDRVKKMIHAEREEVYPYSGKGITVAVLDSGICLHPDIGGSLIGFRDFVSGYRRPYDDSGHGTHVAGCICGSGMVSAGKYAGIAPGARVLSCKVLDDRGEGAAKDMMGALEWCIQTKDLYGTKIVSLSVGTDKDEGVVRMLRQGLELVWQAGLLPVVAAGNQGPAQGSMSALGRGEKVISVGCYDEKRPGEEGVFCEQYSGRGWEQEGIRKPDILAPGSNVVSCCAHYRLYRNGKITSPYTAMSGTSMAVPAVSGAAALLWEKYPAYTNEQIRNVLLKSARDLGKPWNYQGWGLLDVGNMLSVE